MNLSKKCFAGKVRSSIAGKIGRLLSIRVHVKLFYRIVLYRVKILVHLIQN